MAVQRIGNESSICDSTPNVRFFHRDSQIGFLTRWGQGSTKFIRNRSLLEIDEKNLCILDHDGRLPHAQEFVSTKKKIFQTMFRGRPNRFPPPPFCEEEWLELLGRIGLN